MNLSEANANQAHKLKMSRNITITNIICKDFDSLIPYISEEKIHESDVVQIGRYKYKSDELEERKNFNWKIRERGKL